MDNFINFLLLVECIAELGIASLLVITDRSLLKTLVAGFSCASATWTLGIALFRMLPIDSAWILPANQLILVGGAFIVPFFLHFAFKFSRIQLKALFVVLIYFFAFFFSWLAFVPNALIGGIIPNSWGNKNSILGYAYWYFTAYFLIYYSLGFTILWKEYLTAIGQQKNRVGHILFASFVTCTIDLIFNVICVVFVNYKYLWVGPLSGLFWVSMFSYSILRHRLLDINMVISNTIARILTFFALSIVFICFAFAVNLTFPQSNPLLWVGATLVFWLSTCEVYPTLRKKIQALPDKVLVQKHYLYEDVALMLSSSLEKCTHLPEVMAVLETVAKDMKLSIHKAYVLKDIETAPEFSETYLAWDFKKEAVIETGSLDLEDPVFKFVKNEGLAVMIDHCPQDLYQAFLDSGTGACIPFVAQDQVVGLIWIERRRADQFTYDDICMFNFLSLQLGIAINRQRTRALFHRVQKSASLLSMLNQYTHDIKAPLNSVRLIMERAKEATESFKNKIEEQLKRVEDLVLIMLKVANGNRERVEEPVSLLDVITATFKFYKVSGVTLKGNATDGALTSVPMISGDSNDLIILFTNLIKNACEAMKATPKRDLTITLAPTDTTLSVIIADTGPGIPSEKLDKLFEASYTTKASGSGVGLSAIKRVVDEHGATITVTSEVGVGTTFTVAFPILDRDLVFPIQDEKPAIQPAVPQPTPTGSGDKLKILLLEDEEILREGIADRLESLNFEVITVENGQQGLAILDTQDIDCILLDLNMPIMDGRRFMECLPENGKAIPVLVCSSEIGHTLNEEFAHHAHFKGVIEKLLPLEELNGHILTAMGDSQ